MPGDLPSRFASLALKKLVECSPQALTCGIVILLQHDFKIWSGRSCDVPDLKVQLSGL